MIGWNVIQWIFLSFCCLYILYVAEMRWSLRTLWIKPYPIMVVNALIITVLEGPPQEILHFILDPSSHPQTIHLCQVHGQEILKLLFNLTRTWCYSIHKQRLKLLKQWNHWLLKKDMCRYSNNSSLKSHYMVVWGCCQNPNSTTTQLNLT